MTELEADVVPAPDRGSVSLPGSDDEAGAERPEIVVRLGSGIGNQLFQMAAGDTVAAAIGGRCTYVPGRRRAAGPAVEHVLAGPLPRPSAETQRLLGVAPAAERLGPSRLRDGLVRRVARRRGDVVVIRQTPATWYAPFRPDCVGGASVVLLDGCFQHESFFLPSVAEVVQRLSTAVMPPEPDRQRSDTTVVSFRRGDFLTNGWALDRSYYDRALATLGETVARAAGDMPASRGPDAPASLGAVVVIGDDPFFNDLAVRWLRSDGHEAQLPGPVETDPVRRDLALLASADRVIMSNSTFCWWGVVAGSTRRPGRGRAVVAPETWLPGAGPDLGRPDWVAVGNGWSA